MRYALIPIALVALAGCGPRVGTGGTPKRTGKRTVQVVEKELAEAKGAVASLKAELGELHKAAVRSKCYWAAGIATLGLFACVAAAVFLSGFRKYAVLGAMACIAVAALALTAAAFIDYLLPAGIAILAALVVAGIYYWRADQESRDQIVRGVAEIKSEVGDEVKDIMRKHVTPTSEKWIDSARKRLGVD